MPKRKLNPTLPLAFTAAVALHAALLPLVLWGVEGRVPQERVDLMVSSLDVPASAQSGDLIVAEALLRYEASALSEPVILNQIWLSRDRQIDDGDTRLRMAPSPYALFNHPGDREVMFSVVLPQDADGPYQLILLTDADHKVHNDTNRANNTRATPLYITGPQRPELQITTADLPPTAITGGTVFFSYNTTNRGPGWAHYLPPTTDDRAATTSGGAGVTSGGWRDAVYLSTDTTLDERDLPLREFHRRAPLGPGDDYAHTRVALDLPRIPPGHYHLILVTDADQVLDQPSFTAGYYTRPIELRDTNLPDLAVAAITAPGSATLGQPFPLQWTAANLGSVDSAGDFSGGRHDAVYLSRDDTLDVGDTLLTAQRSDTPIPAQSRSVEPTASVTVPNEPQYAPDRAGDTSGGWHLIVVADSDNVIDEGPFEDNNAFAVPIVLLPPRDEDDEPDLGEPENAPRLTVAWIEHQRVEEHMARLTETLQPAIQNLVDPDPNAPLVNEPKPPALPAIALQSGGAPNDPAQPVDPNETQSARPRSPVPEAQDTNTQPRPLDPNAQPREEVPGLPGDGDDLPMPREGEDTPATDRPHNPLRPDTADPRDPDPRNPGDVAVESDADPDAPDTPSDTDSQTPAERDSDTDETHPDDNDSEQPAEVMEESAGETPNENDPDAEPTEQDGDADHDEDTDESTATPEPAEEDSDQPEGDPVPPSNPSEEQETTRAPRDDAEADPTDVEPDRLRLEEGNVLVGQGVRVNTSRIRRGSASSRLTATPRDTLVRIVFDNQGQVVEAEIVGEGTGYDDWDARLLEALYRWTAAGPDIESADPHFVLTLEYQFGLLDRRGE